MEITIDQVRDLIKSEKIKPSDLFGSETLTEDPTVKGYVDAEVKRAVAGEYAHRKRDEEGSLKAKEDMEKAVAEKDAEIAKLKIETAKSQVGSLYEKQKESRKLDDKQDKFVLSRIDKFTPEKAEDIEKEFNTYLDAEIDEYKKISKDVFGIEEEPEKKPDGTEDKDGGTGPDNKKKEELGKEDKYIDPAQNPMIKTD